MSKKITSSTLTKVVARLVLTFALVLAAQAATIISPVLAAENANNDMSVFVEGVKYTPQIDNGQAILLVGDKIIYLSQPNVMAFEVVDQYGTSWMISYSGRCTGYNYNLQKNETSVNLHEFTLKAESFLLSGKYGVAIKKTTGEVVNLPNLEEFKRLAGYTSNITPNVPSVPNVPSIPNVPNVNTSVISHMAKTITVGSTQYTFIVDNGIAKVIVGNKVINIPDINICDIGVDANGTIIIMTYNNGIKDARWYNPDLQKDVVKTNLLASNAYQLTKDSKDLVTGVNMYYSIIKVLTIDEQKKALGITTTTTTTTTSTKVNEERVVKQGDHTYVVYDKNGKRLTKYTFNEETMTLTWRGVTYKNIKRVGVIQKSKNLIVTTPKGNISTIDFDTMDVKRIFTTTESKGKGKSYTITSRGFTTSYITTKGKRTSVKNK